MTLFTKAQYRRLLQNGGPTLRGNDRFPVAKLFTPDGHATWLLTEIDPTNQIQPLAYVISG